MKGVILSICIIIALIVSGFYMYDSQRAYNKPTLRQVVLVDAYDEYNENGRHLFQGIFVDKELGTRFEWPIEPRTFRDFERTGQQADMQVTASAFKVNTPHGSPATSFFGTFLMAIGGLWAVVLLLLGIGVLF